MNTTTTSRSAKRPITRRTPPRRRNEVEPRCVGCDERVAVVQLIIDGRHLTMQSCTNCDHREWDQDGTVVSLRGVLSDITDAPTRYRRDISLT